MAKTIRVSVTKTQYGYIDIVLNDEEEKRIFNGTTTLAQRRRVHKVGEEYVKDGGKIHWFDDIEDPIYVDNWFMEVDEGE